MNFNILSYNIHKGFNAINSRFMLHQLKDALKETESDLLCLQEVVGENHRFQKQLPDWPKEGQLEFLARDFWPHSVYGKNAVFSYRHHGNATLSKFNIVEYHNLNILNHRLEQRGLLHCTLQIPGVDQRIHSLNTHIDLLSSGRRRQIAKIKEYINEKIPSSEPIVFSGDFNDWDGKVGGALGNEFIEAFHSVHGSSAKTFPHFMPFLRLDRIYLRGLKCTEAQVFRHPPWAHLSDHLPIFARISLL